MSPDEDCTSRSASQPLSMQLILKIEIIICQSKSNLDLKIFFGKIALLSDREIRKMVIRGFYGNENSTFQSGPYFTCHSNANYSVDMEESQPAYPAGPIGETVFTCIHMVKFQSACRDRNWTHVKNETRAHCLVKQRMGSIDIFVSVARMECSYGKF